MLFLQQVAGYDALQAGLALMPATLVMFALSKRIGRLADRVGPRLFMGFGPLVAALGLALMLRIDADLDYFTDLLPALLVFSLGLALTVAPLTATVLADADESQRRHRLGRQQRDRARRRACSPSPRSAPSSRRSSAPSLDDSLGGQSSRPPRGRGRARRASRRSRSVDPARGRGRGRAAPCNPPRMHAFHVGIGISATLVALGGVLGLAGIRNPRRAVRCQDCPGGQFAGQPLDTARTSPPLVEARALRAGGARCAPDPG